MAASTAGGKKASSTSSGSINAINQVKVCNDSRLCLVRGPTTAATKQQQQLLSSPATVPGESREGAVVIVKDGNDANRYFLKNLIVSKRRENAF